MNPAFNQLSILQLRALVVMLEVPHLSRAAVILGTSQSTLSRHLAQFREVLGDPLLVRQGRGYTLTERGHQLLEPLKSLLDQIDCISSPAVFSPATCNRRFTLAGSDYVAQYILPDLLRDLEAVAPDVSIDFRTWEPNRFDWLSSGKVDLITSMIDETPADYHGRVIGEDLAVCCMRSDHSLASSAAINQREYLAWPHIKITAGGDKDGFVDAYLRKQQLARNLKLSVPYYCAALSVLQQSDALLTLPEHIARRWVEQADVCFRPLSFITHPFRYWVVWHSRTQNSPEQQWFRQFVHQHCRGSQFLSPGDSLSCAPNL